MANPEVEKKPRVPSVEIGTPPSKEIPEEVERTEGQQAVKKNVSTSQTIPGVQYPAGKPQRMPSITPPADEQVLQKWSKGSPNEAKTWFGKYWLRMILKAVQSGWNIIRGKKGGTSEVKN